MSNFRVGQKVVCVKAWGGGKCGYGDEIGPEVGGVYTIREVGFLHQNYPDTIAVRLLEINNLARCYKQTAPHVFEPCFGAALFKPLVERKTDISIFKAMLNKPRVSVPA